MSAASNAIRVAGVVKTFGNARALDGLDLSVDTGEVHGFLGPNGSGKSTTIRILLGQMRADSGSALVLGGDPWRDAVRLHRRLAYVPGDVNLWPNLSGGEVIDLLARLRGRMDTHRRDELLERFELDPRKKGRAYSKGNRQKVAIVAALAGIVAVAAGTFSAFQQLYPNELERQLLAATVSANPALLALTGPVASTSIGGMTAWRTGVILTTLIGLMAIFTVIRRTRGDEEAGRTELLASCVVGRAAPLAAAVIVAGGAGVLIGILVTAAGIGYGQPVAGSLALGASLTGCAFLYAAVAAVAAQVAESARTATAMSAALLAVGFALRSVGDVSTGAPWLTWVSPQGWAQHVRVYADNQWPVLVLFAVATVVLLAVARSLLERRDLGLALFPARLGPATNPRLFRPWGLAVRLQRGSLIGWAVGLAALGALMGGSRPARVTC